VGPYRVRSKVRVSI